jgi:signal transduction histidine kinase/Tfp pilus assembly protein PilF
MNVVNIVRLSLLLLYVSFTCDSQAQEQSIEFLEEQYTIAKDSKRLALLIPLVEYYAKTQPDKAITIGEEGLMLLENASSEKQKIDLVVHLSKAYFNNKDIDNTKRLLDKFKSLSISHGSKYQQAQLLYRQGEVARVFDDKYNVAIALFSEAGQTFTELGRIFESAQTFNQLGLSYNRLSQYDKAIDYFQSALETPAYNQSESGAYTTGNIGLIHYNYKDWPKAKHYYRKAIELSKQVKSEAALLFHTINLGIMYSLNDEFDEALTLLKQAQNLSKDKSANYDNFDINIRIGEIMVEKKAFQKANEYYNTAFDIAHTLNIDTPIIQIHLAIGRMHQITGNYKKALSFTLKALNIAEKIEFTARVAESHRNLQQTYFAMNDYKNAYSHLEKHTEIQKKRFDKEKTEHVTKLEEQFQAKEKEIEISALKQQKAIDKLKSEQRVSYFIAAITMLVLFAVIIIYWQRKRSTLFAEQTRLMAELVERKNQLLAEVSHEIGTPLTVLKLHVESLKDDMQKDVYATYDALDNKLDEINTLIKDIHQLAQLDVGAIEITPVTVDVIKFFDEFQREINLLLSKNDLSFEYNNKLEHATFIKADCIRFKQVITNLVTNTIRYTDEPGQVKLTITRVDEVFVLHLDDSSPSVEPEDIDKIFERLYRVEKSRNRATGGAGLGLSICKSLIDSHGGQIYAEQSSLGGLRICIELPVLKI